jgi:hypothetical protein
MKAYTLLAAMLLTVPVGAQQAAQQPAQQQAQPVGQPAVPQQTGHVLSAETHTSRTTRLPFTTHPTVSGVTEAALR